MKTRLFQKTLIIMGSVILLASCQSYRYGNEPLSSGYGEAATVPFSQSYASSYRYDPPAGVYYYPAPFYYHPYDYPYYSLYAYPVYPYPRYYYYPSFYFRGHYHPHRHKDIDRPAPPRKRPLGSHNGSSSGGGKGPSGGKRPLLR